MDIYSYQVGFLLFFRSFVSQWRIVSQVLGKLYVEEEEEMM